MRQVSKKIILIVFIFLLFIMNVDVSNNDFVQLYDQEVTELEKISTFRLIQPFITTRNEQRSNPLSSDVRSINDWTMHLNGPLHNSFTNASGPTNNNVLWYNTTGGTTYSSPCVADGRVFLGVGNTMKCYYENNGTLAWTMKPDQNVAGGFGICSSPAYANGCIYFGADRIYCVWATNGTIRWKVDKSNIKHGDGTPTLADGKVFIAGSDYKLYCIDQITGIINWTFQAKSDYPPAILDNWGLYAAPAVSNGSVYLAACDWYIYQINISQPSSTATANNTFKMNWASYSSPVIVGDKVYVGCSYMEKRSEARFYCFWASNLTKIWEFNPNKTSGFFSSAGYYNNQLFIGSIDGALYCLNASSGNELWNYSLGGSGSHDGTWSSPAVTKERFYIGSKSGYIYCFNTTQPSIPEYYWRYYISGEVDTSPSVVPGRVYIGTHGSGGKIYCFGTPDNIPPIVVDHYPQKGATQIPVTDNINVTFNEHINPSSLTKSSFILSDSSFKPVSGTITYDTITKSSTFIPSLTLERGEEYTVTLTTEIEDHWANPLDGNKNSIIDGSPADDFSWNFTTSVNNPPTLTGASVTPVNGTTTTDFEFKIIFTDLDNDTPELDPGYLKVFIDDDLTGIDLILNTSATLSLRDGKYDNGEEYIYSTKFATYGLHKYKFKCSDGIDTIETIYYFNPLLHAKPVLDPIGVLDAYEDSDLTLNLNGFLHDYDTNLGDLIITTNSSYTEVDDLNITFNYPNEFNYPSGRDYEIIAVNVSDSIHSISQDVHINVHAINDPPLISGIPNIRVLEGEYFYLNVTPYISDVDNELDELVVSENSSYATISEKNITFYYPDDSGISYEYLEINVSDGALFGKQDILITVLSEGDMFVLNPIPLQNAVEDIDLIIDIMEFIAASNEVYPKDIKLETNSDYCTITSTELKFNYPNSFNYPSGRTFELVTVNATYQNQTKSISFRINVQAVNDAPILTVISSPTIEMENTTVTFKARYQDVDGSEGPMVSVIIDGIEFHMNQTSGDIHVEGGIFEVDLILQSGDYEYYYWANDGELELNSILKSKTYNIKINETLDPSSDGLDQDKNDEDDDKDDDSESSNEDNNKNMSILWIVIVIIVFFILLLISMLLITKRKTDDTIELIENEEELEE